MMRYIVIISAAIYLVSLMDTTGTFLLYLQFHPGRIMRGEIWRLLTWLFMPLDGNFFFTAIRLYFYYFIGSTLEREWGTPKFTVYYIGGLLLHCIYGFLVWFITSGSIGLLISDASAFGAISSGFTIYDYLWYSVIVLTPEFFYLSMFFAFAVLFPEQSVLLFFILPIKMKWLALIDACYFLYSIITSAVGGRYAMAIIPLVALLNFFIICGGDLLVYSRPIRSRVSPGSKNFRRASRQARREHDDQQFRHKCAVCGKTDADYPSLEFRYCSRCEGFHCYCMDHINSHVHFR